MRSRKPVRLTKEQKDCVEFPTGGNLLVRGIPGSGKTTVLLERARRLMTLREEPVLLLSYSAMLSRFIKELATRLPGQDVEAMTYHGWGRQLLANLGKSMFVISGDERQDIIKFAINIVRKHDPATAAKAPRSLQGDNFKALIDQAQFLSEEFSWIKGNGKDEKRYMTEPRSGRGSSVVVQKPQREWVWTVFQKYSSILKAKRRCDFDDVAIMLVENVQRIDQRYRPQHIMVDEAQDLSAMQLKSLGNLTRKSLTIAADRGQAIYNRGFSWKAIGIDIRGRSRSLTQTHRCTKEIYRLAQSLQRHDPLVLAKDDELTPSGEPEFSGPLPCLYASKTLDAQMADVIDWAIGRLNQWTDDTVGIVLPTRSWLSKYSEALEARRYPYAVLASGEESVDILSPGIKLVTYHSAKGLEFDHVACACLREGTLPRRMPPDLNTEDVTEFLATERRKLYVAMTRAHLELALFTTNPPSQFVGELDPKLYVAVNNKIQQNPSPRQRQRVLH